MSAFQASLAFYSKSRGGHAHSLRWVHQGGNLESVGVFRKSVGRGLPSGTLRPLVIVIALSAFLKGLNIAANALVKESVQGFNASHELVKTTEFISLDTISTLAGWSATVPYNSSISDTLLRTINSTLNIPDAVPNRVYTPRTIPYEVACTWFDFNVLTIHTDVYPNLLSADNGCSTLTIIPVTTTTLNYTTAVITRRPDGSAKVTMPGTVPITNNPTLDLGFLTHQNSLFVGVSDPVNKCFTANYEEKPVEAFFTGITAAPSTSVTKCVYPSGQVVSLSLTSVRYSVPDLNSFGSVSSSVLQSSSRAPVLAMQKSVNDGIFSNLTASPLDSMSVMEVQFSGSRTDVLVCSAIRVGQAGLMNLVCNYSVITAIISKPQPTLPEIDSFRSARKPFPVQPKCVNMVPIDYLPKINGATGSSLYSVSQILDDSSSAAEYLASLGQNFFMDWNDGGLYTVFDTVDMTKGYEIPGWLFWAVVATMAVCLLIQIAAELMLDARFKGSLLRVLTKEIEPHLGRSAPTLVTFKPDTLTVESFRLVDTVKLLDLKEEYVEPE
ncbi:hypothetical protein BG006_002087 [Podila minutissima]|uniref:Transmembrane protein n=1 Tax=Podila minutissima TaxID=64525 RepID=A0A9P5SQV6_9FUNG|nr:hypothetical protein BG006_002087 [Podila minutissima]